MADFLFGVTRRDLEDHLDYADSKKEKPWSEPAARICLYLDLDSGRLRDKSYYAEKWRWHLNGDGTEVSFGGARSRVRRAWPDLVRAVLDRITSYGRQLDPKGNPFIAKVPDAWWEYAEYGRPEVRRGPIEKEEPERPRSDRAATASDRDPTANDRENGVSGDSEGDIDRTSTASDRDPTAERPRSDRASPYTSRARHPLSSSSSSKVNNKLQERAGASEDDDLDLSFLGSRARKYEDEIRTAISEYCPNGREPHFNIHFQARRVFGKKGYQVTAGDVSQLIRQYGPFETCAALELTRLHKTTDPSLSYVRAILEAFASGDTEAESDHADRVKAKYADPFE